MHPSVTDFLMKVWQSPTTGPHMPEDQLSQKIYDLYTPPPPQGVSEQWTQKDYHAAPPGQMGWRVYMSVKSPFLMRVWGFLQIVFTTQNGVVAAKHTTVEAAMTRVDTIVVYLKSAADRDALIAEVRRMFEQKPVPGRPTLPPRLRADMFKTEIPPTTQPAAGLQGISSAQQPLEDGWAEQEEAIPFTKSFGMQLSELVARGYHGAANQQEFFRRVEVAFLEAGVNVNQPWQYLLDQSSRNMLAFRGNLARRHRGYQ